MVVDRMKRFVTKKTTTILLPTTTTTIPSISRTHNRKVKILSRQSLVVSPSNVGILFLLLLCFAFLLTTTLQYINLSSILVYFDLTTTGTPSFTTIDDVIELVSQLRNQSKYDEPTGFVSSDTLQRIHAKNKDETVFLMHTKDNGQQNNLTEQNDQKSSQQSIDSLIGIHNHSIPPIITFTHEYNLLLHNFSFYNKDAKSIYDHKGVLTRKQKEVLAYQENVQNIIQLHPESTIRFLNNNDCILSIYNVMKLLYNNSDTIAYEMIQYFINEPKGMYKGDICRGMALYETGGIYIDVDVGVRHSLWKSIQSPTKFVTSYCYNNDKYNSWLLFPTTTNSNGFFQAFIGVTQYHPIMERYIRLFYNFYKGTISNIYEIQNGYYGVLLLKRAYDEIIVFEQQEQQKQQLEKHQQQHVEQTQLLQQSAVAKTTIEIWYELLYDEKLMLSSIVKRPVWGNSNTCQVVVSTRSKKELYSIVKLQQQQQQQQEGTHNTTVLQSLLQQQDNSIPMYSRIAYSHRCPM